LDEGASIQFTVPIGVASLTQCYANVATLVINADQELYKARRMDGTRITRFCRKGLVKINFPEVLASAFVEANLFALGD
jgi:hypothetical protein